ncbi:MAG: DUF5597 domain-containing protein [Ignavibacteriales bacterium]|nr:DUF5597 domain-containing protein [Ignavibacteriales bacterium]
MMKKFSLPIILILISKLLFAQNQQIPIPNLIQKGNSTQLIVNGQPFLILGGELGNSTFTSLENMESVWPKLKKMNLNTILAPVYWELIEPKEDQFDFELFDNLIEEARINNFKLVLLWFGSWKNSMSSHAPAWVKLDQDRFPRIKDDKGKSHGILTPFSKENLAADKKAFQKLVKHIKETDNDNNTVIMIQPENEIGMLPTARDYHPLANEKFKENVPMELIKYLKTNKEKLVPEFKSIWAKNGFIEKGNWEEIFGKGLHTDEIFMAWYFAKFTNEVTKAGKEEYPLPMYVNAALNRPGKLPGEYPSAGPLPHLMDIWKAAAPDIDFLSPDFYNPDFKHWCDLYTRQKNPLFVPEHRFDSTVAAKTVFAFGHYEAIGFSPFSIESTEIPEDEPLGKIYKFVNQLSPIITKNQGEGKIKGVLLDKENQETIINYDDYEFTVKHSYTLGYEPKSKNNKWEMSGALIVRTNENEFYVLGSGFAITFRNIKNPKMNVGILKTEEGEFVNNKWKVLRHLNGDQTHQGRHIRAFLNDYSIQRFELYNYD